MTDLIESYNARKYGTTSLSSIFDPAVGLAETALSGISSLAGALPAMMYGTYEVIKTGDIQKYPEVFEAIQQDLTYKPRSVFGKEIEKAGAYASEKGVQVADWLGEKAAGGRPEGTLVSAGIQAVPLIAGALFPLLRVASKRKEAKALAKTKAKEHKSILEAMAAGEKLEGKDLLYFRGKPIEKDILVPAQETALRTLEGKVQETKEGSPVEADETQVRMQELAKEQMPIVAGSKGARPTVEDFKRVFEDSEDAKTIRDVVRMDAEEKLDPRRIEVERISPIPTIKVVDEPSYEGLRNKSILEQPETSLPLEVKAPETPTVDLLSNKPIAKLIGDEPKVDLLAKVVSDNSIDVKLKTSQPVVGSLLKGVEEFPVAPKPVVHKLEPILSDTLKTKLEFDRSRAEAIKPMVLGTELNSGFNVAKGLWHVSQLAKAKLQDAFLRPEPGVKIHEVKDVAARMRWRDWVMSPSKVAAAQASFKNIGGLGDISIVSRNRLIMRFGRSLETVDKTLKSTPDAHIHRKNLDDLLLFGDMEGKSFTATELNEMKTSQPVKQAYKEIRRTLDLTHRLINMARKRAGLEPIGYLKGYVSHNLKDWHIMSRDKIIGSASTMFEAVRRANAAKLGGFARDLHIVPRSHSKTVGDNALKRFEDDFLTRMSFKESDFPTSSVHISNRQREFGNLLQRTGQSTVTDTVDVTLREYLNNAAQYISGLNFKVDAYKAYEKEFGDILVDYPKSSVAHYAKKYVNDMSGGQVALDQFINNMLAGGKNSFGNYVSKILGRDAVGTLGRWGGDLANYSYIAARVSSALIQYVSTIYGGAIVGHGRLGKTWYQTKRHPEMAKHKARIMEQIGVSKYSPQLEAFPGGELTKTGKLHKALYAMISAADYDVRSNIGYASYLKSKEEGLSHPEASRKARETVLRSVGELSYADAPAAIREVGKIGRPFYQLQRTLHKSIENAMTLRGKEAIKFWGPFLAMTGYHGIPFMGDVMNLISWATQGNVDPELAMKETLMGWAKDDEDKGEVSKYVQAVATIAQAGLPGLAGYDVGRRIGLGEPITSLITAFGGRPAFVAAINDIVKPAMQGDWADTAFKMIPRGGEEAIKYFVARDELFKGPYDRSRLTITDPTWGEEVSKGIGIKPMRESLAQESGRIEARHKRLRQRMESELIDDYIEAREDNDKQEMADLKQEAEDKDVNKFLDRVYAEIKKKQTGRAARVKQAASKQRKEEIRKYAP